MNKMKSEHMMELNEVKLNAQSKKHLEESMNCKLVKIEKIKNDEIESQKSKLQRLEDAINDKDHAIVQLNDEISSLKKSLESVTGSKEQIEKERQEYLRKMDSENA